MAHELELDSIEARFIQRDGINLGFKTLTESEVRARDALDLESRHRGVCECCGRTTTQCDYHQRDECPCTGICMFSVRYMVNPDPDNYPLLIEPQPPVRKG